MLDGVTVAAAFACFMDDVRRVDQHLAQHDQILGDTGGLDRDLDRVGLERVIGLDPLGLPIVWYRTELMWAPAQAMQGRSDHNSEGNGYRIMRYTNIVPVKERRVNFEGGMDGHINAEYLWAILAASIAALLVFFVLTA